VFSERHWIDDVRRLGDEIAGEADRLGYRRLRTVQLVRALGVGAAEDEAGKARLLVLAFLGQVLGKAIGPQCRAKRHLCRHLGWGERAACDRVDRDPRLDVAVAG
jgi:hypothetical protein